MVMTLAERQPFLGAPGPASAVIGRSKGKFRNISTHRDAQGGSGTGTNIQQVRS